MKRYLFLSLDAVGTPVGDGVLWPAAHAIPSLLRLQAAGFRLVLLSDDKTPEDSAATERLLALLSGQGVCFEAAANCPHSASEDCDCRKPHLGRLRPYLTGGELDLEGSQIIGRGSDDLALARNAGLGALLVEEWREVAETLVTRPRKARVERKTKETAIEVEVNLDGEPEARISTGLGFFDHMLEQLSKHGGFSLDVRVKGDLTVDEHHTVEDTALALGSALRKAAGDKWALARYGFVLPMDEAEARVSLDLSGRAYFIFEGSFPREAVGGLPTELVPHFHRSLAESLGATLHLSVRGENAHHMVESTFKAVGRALRQALRREAQAGCPSTKGTL